MTQPEPAVMIFNFSSNHSTSLLHGDLLKRLQNVHQKRVDLIVCHTY